MRVAMKSLTGADGMWTNRPLAGRPGWEGRETGTDIHAPAGTIVVQNNLNLHAGTVRTSTRPRRTIHLQISNTGGRWGYDSGGQKRSTDAAIESVQQAEDVGGAAAAAFFAGVPEQWRWIFDAHYLEGAFEKGDERPETEKRYSAVSPGARL